MAYHSRSALGIYDAFAEKGPKAILDVPLLSGYYPPVFPSLVALFWALLGKTVTVSRLVKPACCRNPYVCYVWNRQAVDATSFRRNGCGFSDFLPDNGVDLPRNDHRLLVDCDGWVIDLGASSNQRF
jgi:hypothetical protein